MKIEKMEGGGGGGGLGKKNRFNRALGMVSLFGACGW